MYLGFLGMSKEEEIAEIARVQKARRKERVASEKKIDELCPVSDKDNYASRKEKLDVTRHVLRMVEESTMDHLWPDLGENDRCPGRAVIDHERHAAYEVYGTGSLETRARNR